MNRTIRCAHCRCLVLPNPRVKPQRCCSSTVCQRARKAQWQRDTLATDPDYRANQRDCQHHWQHQHPQDWRQYRQQHADYRDRHRLLQQHRDRKRRLRPLAKLDVFAPGTSLQPGMYHLIPAVGPHLAKLDVFSQKCHVIPITEPILQQRTGSTSRGVGGSLMGKEVAMMEKSPLCPQRVRKITGSCACLEHRFVRDGFWTSLTHHELLLDVFVVLVADRNGLSYYSFEKVCALLQLSLDDYLIARNALIKQDRIAFDGHLLQGLSLPPRPVLHPPKPLHSAQQMAQADPATIRHIVRHSLGADHD
jgi:hypothetical protein